MRVTFEGLGGTNPDNLGNAFATALSPLPRECLASAWDVLDTEVTVDVICFRLGGQLVDTKFSVNFIEYSSFTGSVGYAWADEPTITDYTPLLSYQYNSAGFDITVHKLGTGVWDVTMPGLGSSHGNVQVNMGSPHIRASCRFVHWSAEGGGSDLIVRVRCSNLTGGAADVEYQVTWGLRTGLKAPGASKIAYVLAVEPSTASYTPIPAYRYSNPAGAIHVTRTGLGRYVVRLDGMPLGGSAEVTAIGAPDKRCNLTGIRKSGLPQRIGVACFRANGEPADEPFSLNYAR